MSERKKGKMDSARQAGEIVPAGGDPVDTRLRHLTGGMSEQDREKNEDLARWLVEAGRRNGARPPPPAREGSEGASALR